MRPWSDGSMVRTYLMASESSPGRCLTKERGAPGGKRHHRLWPLTRVFHAAVPNGSMWILVPDRAGPITSLQTMQRGISNDGHGNLHPCPMYAGVQNSKQPPPHIIASLSSLVKHQYRISF
jgi:hypothetical protein